MLAAALLLVTLLPGPTEDLRAAAQRIAEREGLQTSLAWNPEESARRPAESSAPLPPKRRDTREHEEIERRYDAEPRGPRLPSASSAAWARILLIVLGVAALAGLLALLVAAYRRPPSGSAKAAPPAPPEPDDALPHAALGPAEALAAAGRFEEAVHRLLLDALTILIARADDRLPAHLTSREVLTRLRLGPASRSALVALVDAVEISLFGGRRLGAADWTSAHAAFTRLAGAGSAP